MQVNYARLKYKLPLYKTISSALTPNKRADVHITTQAMGTLACPVLPTCNTYLTHSAMPACLHVVLALIASVDKAILTLCMKLHQHAHGRPLGSSKRREFQVLIPCKGEKCISTIHQVTGDERVRINNGRQGVGSWTSDEADYKEDLPTDKLIVTLKLQCHCNRKAPEERRAQQEVWVQGYLKPFSILVHFETLKNPKLVNPGILSRHL